MRSKIFFILSLITVMLCFGIPIRANHLDGLWRSDRMQIIVRIEQEQDGFRAKRTDQGIWYHYTAEDTHRFTDRYGNWYELVGIEELVWNEVNSNKRIYFTRVDDRDVNQWNDRGNNYNPNGYSYHNRWNDNQYNEWRNYIDGRWYARNGRDEVEIISFPGGIRVRSNHNGWEKFYSDRAGNRFRDRYDNTIILIDRENLRYRGQYGREEKLFIRHRNWKNERNGWRD